MRASTPTKLQKRNYNTNKMIDGFFRVGAIHELPVFKDTIR